ncbi:glycogen debranching protein GlgX [Phenylobacterium immobile]|uniref:glycogen debranching protein GlgX n=1 Tax=Phenylobacterium immobile TaxID=21 RepID=UPI000B194A8C|nr:glycogen debranching protein GlgX [Phenylobacterium immobile]
MAAGAHPIEEGAPEPLGASLVGDGVNFAVWSSAAEAIEVCLFDAEGAEIARLPLPGRTGPVFHGRIAGLGAGARYGLRAHGVFAPERGLRFDPSKLLIDPYARALDSQIRLHPTMSVHGEDSAPYVAKALVQPATEARRRPPLKTAWADTVIYELHVRGFTRLNPDIPEQMRGTFAGLAHPAAIAHLLRLGVTAVELLPCMAWMDERHLPPLNLTNYWGYNPVAWMTPDPRLAPGGWAEVRAATDALAAAGIETLLDVVFNHSGESDELGPTLSLRGLDNAGYYRLQAGRPDRYVNDAGTGNVLALERPAGMRLAMDTLRTWATLGGIEGFRFDLATTLGRGPAGFDPASPLLAAIDQDPALRDLKLIAEPWDCGLDGYQLGRFPAAWGEWNDHFRDDVRGFWRGGPITLGKLATRLSGSQDVFVGKRPSRSINFVTAHDGFTLADLVTYEVKRNWANGEDNRDGSDHEGSWNNGVEGPSDEPVVRAARLSDQRALLSTLILARGTPMIAMGAEFGHSQAGANNAYTQDNETSWLDWAAADESLAGFTARLIAARRSHPALRQDRFLTGRLLADEPFADVEWRRADGSPLSAYDWDAADGATLVVGLAASEDAVLDRVVLAIHRARSPAEAMLPGTRDGHAWRILADSANPEREGDVEGRVSLSARSVLLLGEVETATPTTRPTNTEALARLAAAAGVAPEWRGFDGEAHPVSADTQTALLAAMGLPAGSTGEALTSLDRLAAQRDRRALPAALTATAETAFTLPLRFNPAHPAPRTWIEIRGDGVGVRRLATGVDAPITHAMAADGREVATLALAAPPLPAGRYEVRREDAPDALCRLTVAPERCFLPPDFAEGARISGLATQLYSLRRAGDQGIGDLTTLGDLAAASAAHGFAVVGINPLHTLFNGDRERASPYYPSDRRFLDPIYLDVPGAGAVSRSELIDYPAVWGAKLAALEAAYAAGVDDAALEAFIVAGGEDLARFALFETIADAHPGQDWRSWPEALRTPHAARASAFAQAHAPRLRFHQYLQWRADAELGAAARRGGLSLGLCRDLAVAAAPDGAEAWAMADLLAKGVAIGAPPDAFAPQGQVWGAPPFNPHALTADGYRAYGRMLAANMRHAGALRVDHALGLARQFWAPHGAEGADGAYVAFPLDDLLGQLALESWQARCVVVGEDLGVVPDGLRAALTGRNVLGYRVLPFERDEGGFTPPEAYASKAWACVGTHDLPPLKGWWAGAEIDERQALGLTPADQAAQERAQRARDRADLVAALGTGDANGPMTDNLAELIHAFVARSASLIAVAQADDLAGETVGVNLPGTDRERPNWRRRLATPLARLFDSPRAQAILRGMAQR